MAACDFEQDGFAGGVAVFGERVQVLAHGAREEDGLLG